MKSWWSEPNKRGSSMLTAAKLAKFFADRDRELLAFLKQHARYDDAPDPAPEPAPKLEPARKGETSMEAMLRRARNDVRMGKAVGMTDLARSVPRVRPPRAPGQQVRRWGGYYWHY